MKIQVATLMLCLLTMNQANAWQADEALQLPECDIFLIQMSIASDGALSLSEAVNITDRPGYDNQPWFTPESRSILFTANHQTDRTDIFEYVIAGGTTRQVTDTPTQEYSPQSSPDSQSVSFVTDGESANQSVWIVDRESGNETWLMSEQGEREPVGYYSWNRETDRILYWSRYGYCVKLVSRDGQLSRYVCGDAPPSTPHIVPGTDHFSFLHRQGNGQVWLKELDPESLAVRPLVAMRGNNPNYCWTPDGVVLLIDNNVLYGWSESEDGGWQEVANLEQHGIQSGTRIATSPDGRWLAVVGLPVDD